jgi:hypothetical protein
VTWAPRPDRPDPRGAAALEERADALLERLHSTRADLRALEAEATWMVREAEGALCLAFSLLAEEIAEPALAAVR